MAPMYPYRCDVCAQIVDVLRDVADRDTQPTTEELAAASLAPCGKRRKTHKLQRVILAPKVAFGERWSPDGHGLKGRH